MDCYRIALPNGRVLSVYPDQLRRIATGLGDGFDQPRDGQDPPIVEALRALPAERRADAFNVAVMRFGEKQDVETISHQCGLSPWQVWELEERFRQAVTDVQANRISIEAALQREMAASSTARVRSTEMLSNAMARGERGNPDRGDETSVRETRDLYR